MENYLGYMLMKDKQKIQYMTDTLIQKTICLVKKEKETDAKILLGQQESDSNKSS